MYVFLFILNLNCRYESNFGNMERSKSKFIQLLLTESFKHKTVITFKEFSS